MVAVGVVVLIYSVCMVTTANGKGLYLSSQPRIQTVIREDPTGNEVWLQRFTDQTRHDISGLQDALETKMDHMETKMTSLDKKLSDVERRIHAVDNFQAYASSWNSQFANIESKLDIMSSFQEKLTNMQDKIESLSNLEETVNDILVKLKFIELMFTTNLGGQNTLETSNTVSNKVLNTLKVIEKNTDKLLLMKSSTSPAIEDILNDVSSKVTALVIKSNEVRNTEEPSIEYEVEESSGIPDTNSSINSQSFSQLLTNTYKHCVNKNSFIEEVLKKATTIENISKILLEKENTLAEKQLNNDLMILDKLHGAFDQSSRETRSLFHEQNAHFQKFWEDRFSKIKAEANRHSEGHSVSVENHPAIPGVVIQVRDTSTPIRVPNKTSCEELDSEYFSGVYAFGNDSQAEPVRGGTTEGPLSQRYCQRRADGWWTVIQRRDNYSPLQSFSLPWARYRAGFGELTGDFWLGNRHIHSLTARQEMVLRVELEDFLGDTLWAQYSTFRVMPENQQYQLVVGGYTGNASDALAYHNGSHFSTYDRKNDEAPACCPCAVSYDGGWWFKSCFKCNLNGQYRKDPDTSFIPYRGIQWQREGKEVDRPFKRSVMMVRPKHAVYSSTEVMPTNLDYSDLTTSSFQFAEEP